MQPPAAAWCWSLSGTLQSVGKAAKLLVKTCTACGLNEQIPYWVRCKHWFRAEGLNLFHHIVESIKHEPSRNLLNIAHPNPILKTISLLNVSYPCFSIKRLLNSLVSKWKNGYWSSTWGHVEARRKWEVCWLRGSRNTKWRLDLAPAILREGYGDHYSCWFMMVNWWLVCGRKAKDPHFLVEELDETDQLFGRFMKSKMLILCLQRLQRVYFDRLARWYSDLMVRSPYWCVPAGAACCTGVALQLSGNPKS